MTKRARVLALSALLVGLAHPIELPAATPRVYVLVENLTNDLVSDCSISKESLRAAVAFPIQASGFALVDASESSTLTVYVNVTGGAPRDGYCVVDAAVEFYFYASVPNPWDSQVEFRQVLVASGGDLLTGAAGTMAARIYDKVERQTKECIVELKTK